MRFCTLGHAHGEVVGMNVSQWDASHSSAALQQVKARLAASPEVCTLETTFRRKDGALFPVEITSFALEVDGGTVLFNSARDITARSFTEEEVKRLAYFHRLTGLPNRRLLMERLALALETCARAHSRGALLFIDLETSRRSMAPAAITRAIICCRRWRSSSAAACARTIPSPAWAATSSSSCSRT